MSFSEPIRTKPKRPPLKRGIKVRKIGATWWGQRWILALEHLSRDYLNRLGRGRAYARAGRVSDLQVAPGLVSAKVTGSDAEPYDVTLRIAMLPPTLWNKAIDAMSQQAMFGAELLAGRMPVTIDEVFRAAGHSLFLSKQRELETDCSCPDWANPCKHVAAVHYVLGEAFDLDPFLLFELRGRTKQQVLGALRGLRSNSGRIASGDAGNAKAGGKNADSLLEKLAAASLSKSVAAQEPNGMPVDVRRVSDGFSGDALFDFRDGYERLRAPLPALQFHVAAPSVSGAILKQLGPPTSWPQDDTPYDALLGAYRDAGQLACDMALGLPIPLPPTTDAGPSRRPKRVATAKAGSAKLKATRRK